MLLTDRQTDGQTNTTENITSLAELVKGGWGIEYQLAQVPLFTAICTVEHPLKAHVRSQECN